MECCSLVSQFDVILTIFAAGGIIAAIAAAIAYRNAASDLGAHRAMLRGALDVAGADAIEDVVAAIDGANWWQRIWYVTLPMMRNIIAITTLFSLIVTFANFDIVKVLTNGGPVDQTHVFATWAFTLGIWGNDLPLGASVSLFMFPILGISAILILRGVRKRAREIG